MPSMCAATCKQSETTNARRAIVKWMTFGNNIENPENNRNNIG